MTARAGVRIEADTRKATRNVKDFSKTAQRELDKVEKSAARSTAALDKGLTKSGASIGQFRGKMRPLAEGMEGLGTVFGTAGSEAQRFASGGLRVLLGPMGLATAAVGGLVIGITHLINKQKEAAEAAKIEAAAVASLGTKYDDLVAGFRPELAFRKSLNVLIADTSRLRAADNAEIEKANEAYKEYQALAWAIAQRAGKPLSFGFDELRGRGAKIPEFQFPTSGPMVPDETDRFTASMLKNQPGMLGSDKFFGTMKTLAESKVDVSIKSIVESMTRLVGPQMTARADAMATTVRRMTEDFDAAGDPVKQLELRNDRLTETWKKQLGILRELNPELKKQWEAIEEGIEALENRQKAAAMVDEIIDAQKSKADRIWEDSKKNRWGPDEARRDEAQRRRDFMGSYLGRPVGAGIPIPGETAGAQAYQPPFEPAKRKELDAATQGLAQDVSGTFKSSLSDAVVDGVTTGFDNIESIGDALFAGIVRNLADSLAETVMNALTSGAAEGSFLAAMGSNSAGSSG